MNYTLNQLRIFLKITQTHSITKAAEALHMTQPAVSIQLKNFQQQFEIPLTEIVNKRLFVTDFGHEIALAVENILNEVEAINHRTMAFRGQLSGRLKISVVSTAKYVAPYFLAGFMKQHPEIELELDVTNRNSVVESLENNEVDFSLVSVLPTKLRLEKVELMMNKLFFVGNSESGFEDKLHSKKVLHDVPLIFREEGSATRHAMEYFLGTNNIAVRKKMVLTSNEAVKQAVIAGLGYSIMPLIGIHNELEAGQLKIIAVKGIPIRSVWNLVWLPGKRLSPVAAAFLKYIQQEKANIVKEKFGWVDNY